MKKINQKELALQKKIEKENHCLYKTVYNQLQFFCEQKFGMQNGVGLS